MKRITTYGILCFFMLGVNHNLVSQKNVSNIKKLTSGSSKYTNPLWSPTGKEILVTSDHNDGLAVINVATKAIKQLSNLPNVGYNANWSDDGKTVQFQVKESASSSKKSKAFELRSINVKSGETSYNVSKQTQHQRFYQKTNPTRKITVFINDDLKLVADTGLEQWIVTPEDGHYYHPLISPDGSEVVVHDSASIYLYSLNNKETKRKKLGEGLASAWNPKGTFILSFDESSDNGHTVSQSDLFQINTRTPKKIKLTNSKDLLEMWPNMSPNGKKITFVDEKSGAIYQADFNPSRH